ncbi:MAG: type II toxin-antitoxin system RelE/ParE family toxin [Deltaproteobacteria bacterium]|nr:type II toxin-antitoxin system RelE/ParE family toxin [Deltaproteobacteria bacterium]MBN2674546.1 type II toxin-antitoxin system RelE/ParE family toxin [Deltaproteobacteria bacterium]
MNKPIYTDQARIDIKEIWLYIAEDSFNAADRVMLNIYQQCESIAQTPTIGRKRPELADGIRSIPIGKYLIFFHCENNSTIIDRVLSGYRNLPDFF